MSHDAQWQALARAFSQGNIPQSLLLSGPPQIGKWTLAQRYSQLLLCAEPKIENSLPAPCGSCAACHQVNIETFPDYKVYRPLVSSEEDERKWIIAPRLMSGSLIPIAVARHFGAEAMRKPMIGKRKVMVLVQVDRMTDDAQNALLKTFEEPIPGLTIFLLCDNADSLRATIRSRCWHIPLNLLSDRKIAHWLRSEMNSSISEEQIEIAVRTAAGRPEVAQREIARFQDAQADSDAQQNVPRLERMELFIARLHKSTPMGALRLTEEALELAKEWWEEEQLSDIPNTHQKSIKKSDAKITRSSIALFLDELTFAYRTRWSQSLKGARSSQGNPQRWSDGLDQIRKTRHYILRNANSSLALDVLFGHLIRGC